MNSLTHSTEESFSLIRGHWPRWHAYEIGIPSDMDDRHQREPSLCHLSKLDSHGRQKRELQDYFQLRRSSRRISHRYRSTSQSHSDAESSKVGFRIFILRNRFYAGSLNLNDIDSESESSAEDELRIPVFMVLFVLLAYTAIGGFLFQVNRDTVLQSCFCSSHGRDYSTSKPFIFVLLPWQLSVSRIFH